MIILKYPEFENDDYLVRLDIVKLPTAENALIALKKIDLSLADYYWAKRRAFLLQDTKPDTFSKFIENKPSLRSLFELEKIDSTIYTVACENENNLSYQNILTNIRRHMLQKPSTRRCILRFTNSFDKYFESEIIKPNDVTCLSFIHYLDAGPKLAFRASDVKNELLVDILTINEFFIEPIYNFSFKNRQMSVYSSTAQGVSSWHDFVSSMKIVCDEKGDDG